MAAARVAVALPVSESFLYAVPGDLASHANVGCRVLVPFRGRKVPGYIIGKEPATEERELKEAPK